MTNEANGIRSEANLVGNLQRFTALLAALLLPAQVWGIGFRIPNQDPMAIGRGNAFVATADNPSAIYYNPAGISQLKSNHVQFGLLNYLGLNTYFESTSGQDVQSDFEILPVPEIYYTYSHPDSAFAFGFGIYAPFGLGVQWPHDPVMHQYAIESRLQYVTINPVVAWKPHPTLSIGAGPMFNLSHIKFRRGLLTATDEFLFKGDDFSVGFNAGILWQPLEEWSFGINYRSAATMHYDGETSYDPGVSIPPADTKADVHFPQIVCAGVSYRPTTNWNIEVNVDYTDWNNINTVVLKGTSNLGFPFDLPFQFNWRQSWYYEVGATRYFENGWYVSAGYFYCSETCPDSTFTPLIPDTVLHVGSIGFGRAGERWDWAVAAQLIMGPERSITTSPSAPSGTYQLIIPTVSASIGYKF
jgi:long-chain fatty acid transport protein